MAWHNIAFSLLTFLTCLYALVWGGAPERWVAVIILAASIASGLVSAPWLATFRSLEIRLLLVDLLTLVAFLTVSQNANRAWPIVVSGLQLAAVGVHVAEALNGNQHPFGYAVLISLPGWASLPCLAAGTWRHRRRLKTFGTDLSWTKLEI